MCSAVGKPEQWPDFHALGIASPSIEGLRALACSFYAYHAAKFRASEFVMPPRLLNPLPGTGFTVPHTFTHSVDADISVGIFVGAFRAAALVSGLPTRETEQLLHNETVSDNETIPTEGLVGGCLAHTVQEAAG